MINILILPYVLFLYATHVLLALPYALKEMYHDIKRPNLRTMSSKEFIDYMNNLEG